MRYSTMLERLLVACGLPLLIALLLVSRTHAEEPPECDLDLYGMAVTLPNAANGPAEAVAIYPFGDVGVGNWEATERVVAKHGATGEELALSRFDPASLGLPLEPQLTWFRTEGGAHFAFGQWHLEALEGVEVPGARVFHSLAPQALSRVMEVTAAWRIREVNHTHASIKHRAADTLAVTVEVPGDWRDAVPENALLAIRIGLDSPPGATRFEQGDEFRVLSRTPDLALGNPTSSCEPGVRADWFDHDTLHGLVWPFGADPAQLAMRFQIDLAAPREAVIRQHQAEEELDPWDAAVPSPPADAAVTDGEEVEMDTGTGTDDAPRSSDAAPPRASDRLTNDDSADDDVDAQAAAAGGGSPSGTDEQEPTADLGSGCVIPASTRPADNVQLLLVSCLLLARRRRASQRTGRSTPSAPEPEEDQPSQGGREQRNPSAKP